MQTLENSKVQQAGTVAASLLHLCGSTFHSLHKAQIVVKAAHVWNVLSGFSSPGWILSDLFNQYFQNGWTVVLKGGESIGMSFNVDHSKRQRLTFTVSWFCSRQFAYIIDHLLMILRDCCYYLWENIKNESHSYMQTDKVVLPRSTMPPLFVSLQCQLLWIITSNLKGLLNSKYQSSFREHFPYLEQ